MVTCVQWSFELVSFLFPALIFDGEYGSDVENKLEAQFDVLMEKQQRISVAYTKWRNAKVLLQHAVSQMQVAVAKWTDVAKIDARYVVKVAHIHV